MKKIVLISCVNQKLSHPAKAQNLYRSPLFRYNYKFAKSLHPKKIFILSAKYGLLNPNKIIKPYNKTLLTMSSKAIKQWAIAVINQLGKVSNLKRDNFIFLAGEKYRKYLLPHISYFQIPLKGLKIGEQLEYLKKKTTK